MRGYAGAPARDRVPIGFSQVPLHNDGVGEVGGLQRLLAVLELAVREGGHERVLPRALANLGPVASFGNVTSGVSSSEKENAPALPRVRTG